MANGYSNLTKVHGTLFPSLVAVVRNSRTQGYVNRRTPKKTHIQILSSMLMAKTVKKLVVMN